MKKKIQARTRVDGLFLANFQSIKSPTFIRFLDLTFLYGPNSAGKSALVDALGFWRKKASGESIKKEHRRWLHRSKSSSGVQQNLRIGISLRIESDWEVHVGNSLVETRRDSSGDQDHLDWVRKLVGHSVQLEYELRDPIGGADIAYKFAIDGFPVFTLGEQTNDSCGDFYSDPRDLVEEGEPIYSELTIYDQHWFWKKDYDIGSISELVRNSNHEALKSLINRNNEFLRIFDIDFDNEWNRGLDFDLSLGDSLYGILARKLTGLRIAGAYNLSADELEKLSKKIAAQKALPDDEGERLRWRLDSLFEKISLFRELIESVVARAAEIPLVSGDRKVLGSDSTEYLVHPYTVDRASASLKTLMSVVAAAIASDTAKNKAFKDTAASVVSSAFTYGEEPRGVNVLSDWLQKITTPGAAYRFSVHGYELVKRVGLKNDSDWLIDFPDFSGAIFLKLYVVDSSGRRIELGDVGSGISHVLPVLATLWAMKDMLVQQPELHLHPAAQCELGDIFISAVNGGRNVVIETHSEHLLLRILRRIRESTLGLPTDSSVRISNDKVYIYYFEPLDDGSTRVKEIRISRDGDFIDRWPKGFFTERANELFT